MGSSLPSVARPLTARLPMECLRDVPPAWTTDPEGLPRVLDILRLVYDESLDIDGLHNQKSSLNSIIN